MGKQTLPVGSVCKQCNEEFHSLDIFLKKGHPAMMDAFQVDPLIKGRNRKAWGRILIINYLLKAKTQHPEYTHKS